MILLQRRGGKTSARILEKLFERPYNSNQISNVLNISYNTATRHFRIMVKNNLVEMQEINYVTYYSASESLIKEKEEFFRIKELL